MEREDATKERPPAPFGISVIDTQALTHLACLGYAVHHEEDEEIEHRHEKSKREAMSEILAAVSMELCQ